MRIWPVGMSIVLGVLMGCKDRKQAKPAGSDLPISSGSSVALPGATDAADAPHSPSVAESQDARVATYRDPMTGVSFRYPAGWRPAAGQGLPVPEFSGVAGAPRLTQLFTPEGTAFEPTVLRALAFSYTVKEGSDETGCAALPVRASANAMQPRTVSYGGVAFTEAAGGDAAMCTHVAAQVDSTLRGSQCLVFERDIVTNCPYVRSSTSPRPLTNEEATALQRRLDAIMASVGIAPK